MKNKLPNFFKEKDGQVWLEELDRENLKLHYRVKGVISSEKSPFQMVNVVDLHDFGKCLVLDGVVQTTALDGYIYNEMISHIPLITHENPKDVLVIGGGDCGVINEVIKYDNIESIDMVEIDEIVVKECIKHIPEIAGKSNEDSRVRFIFGDGVKYVNQTEKKYDIVIVDSSDPIGPAIELFTEKFYKNVKKCLKEDGLMVCQSESPIFYRDVMKQTFNRLRNIFEYTKLYTAVVPSYPGGLWSFTLASNKYTETEANLEQLVEDTNYVNKEVFRNCFELPNFIKNSL